LKASSKNENWEYLRCLFAMVRFGYNGIQMNKIWRGGKGMGMWKILSSSSS